MHILRIRVNEGAAVDDAGMTVGVIAGPGEMMGQYDIRLRLLIIETYKYSNVYQLVHA